MGMLFPHVHTPAVVPQEAKVSEILVAPRLSARPALWRGAAPLERRILMYAAVLEGPKKMVYQEVETPRADGNGVLIQVKKAAICGSDKHSWESATTTGILGHEYSGIVVDPGSRSDLSAGDRVTHFTQNPCLECNYCREGNTTLCDGNSVHPGGSGVPGSNAEFILARPDLVRKLPDSMSLERAALSEPVSVAYRAVKKTKLKPGGKLLISGVGALTAFSAQIAKAMGASFVACTGSSQARAQAMLDSGDCDFFVNTSEPGLYSKLMEAVPEGFDACIDNKGFARIINENLAVMKKGAICVVVGIELTDADEINLFDMIMNEQSIVGTYSATIKEFDECLKMMTDGSICPELYASKTFPLSEAQQAFEYSISRGTLDYKVFLEP